MTAKTRRKRWSEVEAARVLDEADNSGLSDSAFAKEAGTSLPRMTWWRSRLQRQIARRSKPRECAGRDFVEVRTLPKPEPRASPELPRTSEPRLVEVVLRNGRVLRVPGELDPERLVSLAAALEE